MTELSHVFADYYFTQNRLALKHIQDFLLLIFFGSILRELTAVINRIQITTPLKSIFFAIIKSK